MRLYSRAEVEHILRRDFQAKPSGIDTGFAQLWQLPNKRFFTLPHPDPGMSTYSPNELALLLKVVKQAADLPTL